MAEMNLNQIRDTLQKEFTGESRKLVFWYDANGEFSDDIESLGLDNAKVLYLQPDNQFYIKYFLECEDRTTNYLVYAPFGKPSIRDNHLEDTIRYSKEFFADRASILADDLGIHEQYKPILQKYSKFFANKERMQKFYDLEVEFYDKDTIEVALMGVVCKCKTVSFEEVLRCILTDDDLKDNKYIVEFEKYGLLDAFWEKVGRKFGYRAPDESQRPTLEKLLISMFVTYTSKVIHTEIPKQWKDFVLDKYTDSIVFLDHLMNSSIYGSRFDELSNMIWDTLHAKSVLQKLAPETIMNCNIFAGIDDILIDWMIARLENEDINAKLEGRTIPEICLARRKEHFGRACRTQYFIIENAYHIIAYGKYVCISDIEKLVTEYTTSMYTMDRRYRYFYYHLDSLEDMVNFEHLRDLVENIYTNEYLNPMIVNWNAELAEAGGITHLDLQKHFYSQKIKNSKERTVVIISDALRYEVACTLLERLEGDEKCKATISAMQGVLPSYTPLGMASLLPYQTIEYDKNYVVKLDDEVCNSTVQREAQLQKYHPNSRCTRFDLLKNMKQKELREIFTGQEVIYIYHNQIDARGDSANTENEVFNACEEAIKEIHELIRRLSSQANTHHFYVTADHGFIYKRDRLEASDKIRGASNVAVLGQRYALSEQECHIDGVGSTMIGKVLGSEDDRYISYPLGSDIFKAPGAGQNFVHGGSSPQEMIVPLLEVKVDRGKKETTTAEIAVISNLNKITNLITNVEFIQTEPISDIVKETKYRVYFVSEDNRKISNEVIVIADKKDSETGNRIFKLRFNFKNEKYDMSKQYYLVAYDEHTSIEVLRHSVRIDLSMTDDFWFFD